MWNLPPPPGFLGLRPDQASVFYQRHMPHWRQDGATYFVTFRLNDSLPQARLRELRAFRENWERTHPPPRNPATQDALAKEIFQRIERWLDRGYGACHLRKAPVADQLEEAMKHFDGERYELGCFAIMPNHLHTIVRPLQSDCHSLESIVGSWKSFSSRTINKLLKRTGPLWQDESYDRIVRDEEHLWRTIQYIGRNPRQARVREGEFRLWLRPEWEQAGWIFEDGTGLETRPT